jgi:signal transduction histidine kinase
VRNPLNAAKLQLELLERRLRRQGDDPRMTDPVGLAHHEIQRLTDMLNEFLAFARPPDLHVQDSDVVTIARQVIELERAFADHTGAQLSLATGPGEVIARVDPGKLHQIVQNLVRNGIEAAGRDGHVEVGVAMDRDMLHVRVSDDGSGISDAIRARIYEPFFSTKEGGTGMGMSIVHNFVAMHGGRIDLATSTAGTIVDVAIPQQR